MKSRLRSMETENGQSLVELAVSITLLMILLAGTIDLGRAFFTWLALRDAAQEGASYGSIIPPSIGLTCNPASPAPICLRVWDNLGDVVNDPNNDIIITIGIIDHPCLGNTVQVDVDYPSFPLTMPFLGTILGSQTIPIHATINDTILTPICP